MTVTGDNASPLPAYFPKCESFIPKKQWGGLCVSVCALINRLFHWATPVPLLNLCFESAWRSLCLWPESYGLCFWVLINNCLSSYIKAQILYMLVEKHTSPILTPKSTVTHFCWNTYPIAMCAGKLLLLWKPPFYWGAEHFSFCHQNRWDVYFFFFRDAGQCGGLQWWSRF